MQTGTDNTPSSGKTSPPARAAATPEAFVLVEEGEPVQSKFYTDPNLERIIENLDDFRASMKTAMNPDIVNQKFPAVCLVGLGRCGSNIALEIATLVHKAKDLYVDTVTAEDVEEPVPPSWTQTYGLDNLSGKTADITPINWVKSRLPFIGHQNKPEFLIEPVVLLGDLDVDIAGRIGSLIEYQDGGYLKDYSYMQIMDLSEVHAGGAGHAPILGQYLAKIILNKKADSFINEGWKYSHSYLIDSCGIRANQSRLYFYIFSSGGGTGSGMASEFGLAQQYAYMNKTLEQTAASSSLPNQPNSFVYEPIFSCGIAVLPNMPSTNAGVSEALHMNAGRMLTKYFSEEWNFSYSEGRDDDKITIDSAKQIIRPWNSLMLVSNDIMRYAEETDNNDIVSKVDVRTMEKYANQYISQQVFNILTAQAVTSDYDENYFKKAGIDISETIRLDANDLFMSMAGPVAVSYSETVIDQFPRRGAAANGKQKSHVDYNIDIDDLFLRSIDLPHFNAQTQAIEGMSILPMSSERYKFAIKNYKDSGFDPTCLNQLRFFKNCSSVISIVSVPKHFKFSYSNLNRLKYHLDNLFPNTTLKRYALVIGTSANLTLTTLITKSPCLSDEVITLMAAYVKRCFSKPEYVFNDMIERKLVEMIGAKHFDENELDEYLTPHENPSKVLDTNWFAIKPMYEKKYRELVKDEGKFVSINDIRLTVSDVKRAIKYLREVYNHRINKTQMLSLNTFSVDDNDGVLLN